MSDQFQHVMVLVSIIVGLGITNALSGVSGAIESLTESDGRLRLGWISGLWLVYMFLWLIDFWWWEFRLADILKQWTLWNYFLIVFYAVVLFLLVALLVPRDWGKIDDLDVYFLAKRRWFYPLLAFASLIDLMDSYMKGGLTYIRSAGVLSWAGDLSGVPLAVIGCRATGIRTHTIIAAACLIWQVLVGFDAFPLLHV